MYKETGLAGKAPSIVLQPWLWICGVAFLIAVALAGQAGRYFWSDSMRVEGAVRHFESSGPLAGAFVEVVWEELRPDLSQRRLYRALVQADEQGHYHAELPDAIRAQLSAPPSRGQPPLRIHAYTARAYVPGYRHLHSSQLFHQRVGYVPSSWNSWNHSGFTIEVEEPDARDRAGDVRLMPATGSDQQRIRQLYGSFLALGAASSYGSASAQENAGIEKSWLNLMCREADSLRLERELELQMREEICNSPAFMPAAPPLSGVATT